MDPTGIASLALGALSLFGVVYVAYLNSKSKPGDLETSIRQTLLERLARQDEKIASQDRKIDELRANSRVYEDYASLLRQHIEDEKGPPPPTWPKELL